MRQREVWCERVAPSAQADSVVVVGNDHCSEIGGAPAKQEPCRIVACDARIVTVVLRLRLDYNSVTFSANARRRFVESFEGELVAAVPILEAPWVAVRHVREVPRVDGAVARAGEEDTAVAVAGGRQPPSFQTEVEFAVLPRGNSARSVSLRDVSEVRAQARPRLALPCTACSALTPFSSSLSSLPPSLPSRYPPQQIELALASPSLPLRSQGTWGPLIDPFDLLRVAEHRVTSYSIDEKGGQE